MKHNKPEYTRNVEAPVESPDDRFPGSTGTRFNHPAFGQIVANRVGGGAILYGSDFRHRGYVSITIKRSTLHRDLSRDWPLASGELITVNLSEAQWARFVSAMNIGDGAQCTIERIGGEEVPGIPDPADRRGQFAREQAVVSEELQRHLAAARAAVLASGLSEKKQKTILDSLHMADMKAGSSQEWVADQFSKHMETTVEHAAIEIDAMMTAAVQQVGLDTIRERGISVPSIEQQRAPKLAQTVEERLASGYDLEELNLPIRTHNVLHRAGILTIEELTTFSSDGLLALDDFGAQSLADVRAKLRGSGFALHGEKA